MPAADNLDALDDILTEANMTGPITPHIEITDHTDGVLLKLKNVSIVLPPEMARDVAELLILAANQHDPLGVTPLPVVTPQGDPL